MIQCPQCKNTLPDWVNVCQFCQTDVSQVARSGVADDVGRHGGKLPDKTIWGLYYAISAMWLINGATTIIDALRPKKFLGETVPPGAWEYAMAAIGGVTIIIGIGLLCKLEIVRGVVNVLSGLNLLFGILGLIGSLMSIMVVGAFGLLFVFADLLRIIVAGATIWIIGETQSRVSNI